ncbi:MAG: hypothetical protein CFE21_17095 [Bacteroidetes bacterium B1(2017)]|nr:MAG: hypothetical protein CFE21_17095 [Bacteroidetes bacterium B1(2017)]
MKKLILIVAVCGSLMACNNEPKLNQQEETAVQNQLSSDQKAMDSLEAAIQAQMDAINADSAGMEMDSL